MNYKEALDHFLSQFLSYKLYNFYSDFIPKDKLNSFFSQQLIAQSLSQFSIVYLKLEILSNFYSAIYSSFESVKRNDLESRNHFNTKLMKLGLFVPIYGAAYLVNCAINTCFRNKFNQILTAELNDKLLSVEAIIKLKSASSNITDAKILVKNLKNDIELITYKGTNLLNNRFTTIISGIYATTSLIGSPILLSAASIYNQLSGLVHDAVLTKQVSLIKPIKDLESKLNTIEEYVATNSLQILRTDSQDLVKLKREKIINELTETKNSKALWDEIVEDMWIIDEVIAFIFNYAVSANEVFIGNLPRKFRWKYIPVLKEFSNLFLWSTTNKYDLSEISYAIERITELRKRINNSNRLSQLTYSSQSLSKGICFKKFSLKMENKSLIFQDNLCIKNQVTAVTGASGCGKSTFFDVIKGIQFDLDFIKGEIIYSKNTKITILSQEINIIPDITLLELISENKAHRAQAIELLKKLSLVNFIPLLDSKLDWQEYLSGGQKQLIAVIGLIIAKPNIALLDEVFSGLSYKLVHIVQDLLVKNLPNTIFLVVDHEAQHHNQTGFYQSNLCFSDDLLGTTVNLQDFF